MTEKKQLQVILTSFGYKYGSPADMNLQFDVRFLANPYWVESLRPMTGLVSEVSDYVLESPETKELLARLEPLIELYLARNRAAGKEALHIGIGCTGGRHRSVAVTEWLAARMAQHQVSLDIVHRDIDRDG